MPALSTATATIAEDVCRLAGDGALQARGTGCCRSGLLDHGVDVTHGLRHIRKVVRNDNVTLLGLENHTRHAVQLTTLLRCIIDHQDLVTRMAPS